MQNQQQPVPEVPKSPSIHYQFCQSILNDIKKGAATKDGIERKKECIINKRDTFSFMIDLTRKNMNDVPSDIKRGVEEIIKKCETEIFKCNMYLDIFNAGLKFILAREELELACQIFESDQEPPTKRANTGDK